MKYEWDSEVEMGTTLADQWRVLISMSQMYVFS